VAAAASADSLAGFAKSHGLAYAETVELPPHGQTLTRGGKVEGAATGTLPGGIDGSLVHYTYTHTWTDSDNNRHSEERPFTLVVARVPESIGFLPYMGFSGRGSNLSPLAGGDEMKPVKLGDRFEGASAAVYKGTSESWFAQLFSPALADWLARSDEDWGFELANGVLCAGRGGYRTEARELEAICEDAAHLAAAIREESVEEVAGGSTSLDAAKDPHAADPQMEEALAKLQVDPPPYLTAALPTYTSYARRAGSNFFGALKGALILTLVLNVPGIALPIVTINEGAYAILAAIELALLAIIFFFMFRSRVRKNGKKYAEEAFYRAYAGRHGLRLEEPLRFAASHAEAKLPFRPDRVMMGSLPGGGEGALVLSGDGSKRSDRVAVVAGPRGPVAEAALESEAPGLSAKDLDVYFEQLAGEAREASAAPA
jgi:hypothetical protein